MIYAHRFRILAVVVASLLILASCSSAEETSSTAPASTEAATAVDDATNSEASPETTIDNRSEEERIIDAIDAMAFQLGITDLETATDCVLARLESEGLEPTGANTAELIALNRCQPQVISFWLPVSNAVLAPADWNCTVLQIGEWINELSIPDAEAFLSSTVAPDEFVQRAGSACNISPEDVARALA